MIDALLRRFIGIPRRLWTFESKLPAGTNDFSSYIILHARFEFMDIITTLDSTDSWICTPSYDSYDTVCIPFQHLGSRMYVCTLDT